MGKIYCICGKSSTGKDTIYKRILSDESLSLNNIVTCTTRPIREGEVDGREYRFITDEQAVKLEADGKVIELRAYNTVHGIWKYMTVDDGNIDLANKDYLIIGTLESYVKCRSYFGTENILPIYIEVDDGVRLERALEREKKQDNPKYEEMCRRFLADAKDFSNEKLEEAGIKDKFINNSLEECVEEIMEYIRNN
ncbi:MAG: guanylate kinase [Lachnospiraceae bacterium]|nr:guanylate kinase [Lachnospiraceae bacterium]